MITNHLEERIRVANIYFKDSGILEYIEKYPEWYKTPQRKVELFNMTNLTYCINTNITHSHWSYFEDEKTLTFKSVRDGESVINMRLENIDMVSPKKGSVWSDNRIDNNGLPCNNTFFIHREMGLLFIVLDHSGTIH